MRKIANTHELVGALEGLLAYTESHQPSRAVLASELRELARRVIASDETQFMRLTPGQQIQVDTPLYRKRLLRVTGAPERVGNSWYVYVESGKVRPGHRAGGSLKLDSDGQIWFQPTLQQQVSPVERLQVLGDAPTLHG